MQIASSSCQSFGRRSNPFCGRRRWGTFSFVQLQIKIFLNHPSKPQPVKAPARQARMIDYVTLSLLYFTPRVLFIGKYSVYTVYYTVYTPPLSPSSHLGQNFTLFSPKPDLGQSSISRQFTLGSDRVFFPSAAASFDKGVALDSSRKFNTRSLEIQPFNSCPVFFWNCNPQPITYLLFARVQRLSAKSKVK